MLIEIFSLFGLMFWLLLTATVIAVIASIETNSGRHAPFIFIGFLILLVLFSDANPKETIAWLREHQWTIVASILGLIALATVWMPAKWALFCFDIVEFYEELLSNKRSKHEIEYELRSKLGYTPKSIRLDPKDNKERILWWGVFAPFSIVWTILDDFIIGIIKRIRDLSMGWMQKISNYVFKDVKELE